MSVRVIDQVWKTSEQRGGPLLVLLALADFADDDGIAWPSMDTLAQKARVSERSAHRIVAELIQSGMLAVEHRPGRASLFHLLLQGCHSDRGANLSGVPPVTGGGAKMAGEGVPKWQGGLPHVAPRTVTQPSVKPSETRHARARASQPTKNLNEPETPHTTNNGVIPESRCPMGPHTFTGSYSDHLANDPRHQVRKREETHDVQAEPDPQRSAEVQHA